MIHLGSLTLVLPLSGIVLQQRQNWVLIESVSTLLMKKGKDYFS